MFKQIYVNRLIKHTEEVMVLNFISRFSKIRDNTEVPLAIRCNACRHEYLRLTKNINYEMYVHKLVSNVGLLFNCGVATSEADFIYTIPERSFYVRISVLPNVMQLK